MVVVAVAVAVAVCDDPLSPRDVRVRALANPCPIPCPNPHLSPMPSGLETLRRLRILTGGGGGMVSESATVSIGTKDTLE